MGGRLLGAEPVVKIVEGVGVGIEVEQGGFLTAGQRGTFAAERLNDAAGDGVVAADRHGPHA